jgi:hypothetical protein
MPSSKGTLYTSVKLFAERRFGPDAVEQTLHEMSAEDRDVLAAMVPVGWYPLEPMLRFHRVLDRLFGRGDLALCTEIGRFSAEWQLNLFHKLVLKFKSPQWMVQKAGLMWKHYHDTGRWEVEQPDAHSVMGRLQGFGVVDEVHCLRLHGWFTRAIELTGGKDVRIHEPSCRNRGDRFCEYVGSWRS